MPSNEQENVSPALVPSLLLVLLVTLNIVILAVVCIKKKRKLRKRIRENFIVKMSDLTDRFADDAVSSMRVDEREVGSSTMYMSFETMQQEQRSNTAEPLDTSEPHEAYDQPSTSILQTGEIVFFSNKAYSTKSQTQTPKPADNTAAKKPEQENQKSKKRGSKFKLKITSKKLSKRKGKGNKEERSKNEQKTDHLGDQGVITLAGTTNTISSIPFSPNDAYNCKDEPLPPSEQRLLSQDQSDYTYIDDEEPNDTFTMSQDPHYTYIDNKPIDAANNTLNQEGQPLSSNEGYYSSIEQASAPDYTYIAGELHHGEPNYYASIKERSTSVDYYTCSEEVTAAQSGAYYSTVAWTDDNK